MLCDNLLLIRIKLRYYYLNYELQCGCMLILKISVF